MARQILLHKHLVRPSFINASDNLKKWRAELDPAALAFAACEASLSGVPRSQPTIPPAHPLRQPAPIDELPLSTPSVSMPE